MLEKNNFIPNKTELIFALDFDSKKKAYHWVDLLAPTISFFKIGLQLFTVSHFEVVDCLLEHKLKVMLDLKLYDIPNTVANTVKKITKRKIDFLTVHSEVNTMKAAVENKNDTKILAVTVLTSLDDSDLLKLGYRYNTTSLVLKKTELALECGCDGIVCSGKELPYVRKQFGYDFIVVIPAIRLETGKNDQKRISSDLESLLEYKPNYFVLGRTISANKNPINKLKEVKSLLCGGI